MIEGSGSRFISAINWKPTEIAPSVERKLSKDSFYVAGVGMHNAEAVAALQRRHDCAEPGPRRAGPLHHCRGRGGRVWPGPPSLRPSSGTSVQRFRHSSPMLSRIRDVYPGSEFFPSRIRIFFFIPDPRSESKNLSILTQKIVSGSWFFFTHSGSRGQNTYPQHWLLTNGNMVPAHN